MANSMMHKEFQKRIKEETNERAHSEIVIRSILEHKYLGTNIKGEGDKEKDGR